MRKKKMQMALKKTQNDWWASTKSEGGTHVLLRKIV